MLNVQKQVSGGRSFLFLTSEQRLPNRQEILEVPCSGTSYSLAIVADELAKLGCKIIIACPNPPETSSQKMISYFRWNDREQPYAIFDNVKTDAVIIVGHAHEFFQKKIETDTEVFLWLHNWIDSTELIRVRKNINPLRIICVSSYHALFYKCKTFFHAKANRQFVFINNPLDIESCKVSSKKPPPPFKDGVHFVFVGLPSPVKGFDLVKKLFAMISSQIAEAACTLHVFGDSSLYGKNKTGESKNVIDDLNIVFHGSLPRRELYEKIAKYHFAIGGLNGSETFCLSLLDAAANGLVPVTINSGGQTSFLNKDNAVIGDTLPLIVSNCINIIKDSTKYKELQASGAKLVKEFNPSRIAKIWQTTLESKSHNPSRMGFFEMAGFCYSRIKHKINRR